MSNIPSSSKAAGSQQKSWARRYKEQLVDQKEQWLDTGKKSEEDAVIAATLAAIEKAHGENKDEVPLPSNISEKIRIWFINYASTKGSGSRNKISGKGKKAEKKYKKSYSARDVVVDMYSDRVLKKVDSLSGHAKSGSPAWLKHYPAAVSHVVSKLSKQELAEVQRVIDDWESAGPPDGIKSLNADRRFGSKMKDVIKEVQKTMGVQMFVIAGYRRPNGELVKVRFESEPSRGKRFTKYKGWKKGTYEVFENYLNDQYPDDEDSNRDSEEEDDAVQLFFDSNGNPLLPPLGNMTMEKAKSAIRQYWTATYQKFTVNKSAKVPWGAIIKDPDHFISAEHQPLSGVVEPSRYRADNLRKDWGQWESMQKSGLRGLMFENALKKDLRSPEDSGKGKGKGKGKAAYIEPSSDEDEPSEDEEQDGDDGSGEDDEMDVEENADDEEDDEEDDEVEENEVNDEVGATTEGEVEQDELVEMEEEAELAGQTVGPGDQMDDDMTADRQDKVGTPPAGPPEASKQPPRQSWPTSLRPSAPPSPRPTTPTSPRPTTPTSPRPSAPASSRPSPHVSSRPSAAGSSRPSPPPSSRPSPPASSGAASGLGATGSVIPDINSPAANHVTPDAMVTYLRSLSSEKVYVEFIEAMLAAEGFNSAKLLDVVGIPPFLQWPSGEKYLPAQVHEQKGFKIVVKQVSKVVGQRVSGGAALAFGLLLREIHRTHFLLGDPGEEYPPDTPEWVVGSPLEMSWMEIVFSAMAAVLSNKEVRRSKRGRGQTDAPAGDNGAAQPSGEAGPSTPKKPAEKKTRFDKPQTAKRGRGDRSGKK